MLILIFIAIFILIVKGITQNVETYTLRTDSLVVDCFLGQGVALDWLRPALRGCFNAKLQDAISQKAYKEWKKIII